MAPGGAADETRFVRCYFSTREERREGPSPDRRWGARHRGLSTLWVAAVICSGLAQRQSLMRGTSAGFVGK
jgi:hypothetical protein